MSDGLAYQAGKIEVRCSSCQQVNAVAVDKIQEGPVCGTCKKDLALNMPMTLNDQNFADLISRSQLPVLVDFWAPWCGPCRMMTPLIESLARKHQNRLLVAKLNTQENPQTPARFGVQGIPTLILFRQGKEAKRQVGLVPENVLEQLLS